MIVAILPVPFHRTRISLCSRQTIDSDAANDPGDRWPLKRSLAIQDSIDMTGEGMLEYSVLLARSGSW